MAQFAIATGGLLSLGKLYYENSSKYEVAILYCTAGNKSKNLSLPEHLALCLGYRAWYQRRKGERGIE
jgi:hypothetical protein